MPRRLVSLFHRIERALTTLAPGADPLEMIQRTAGLLAHGFAEDLGIRGGRIYAQHEGSYQLEASFGDVPRAPLGLRVWRSCPPFDQLLDTGTIVVARGDPRLDQSLEQELGARDWFAAVAVANGDYVLSFDVAPRPDELDDLVATLAIVRLAINQKLRERRMRAIMEDARQVQLSILPRHLPSPGDFEIAARSLPGEAGGGDFYDVVTLDERTFVVAVADATGQGLPAALQVRDLSIGLRMGLARELRLTRTVERLNGIVHSSRLATKLVSLFLAEIHANGTVLYCNADHPPALLMHADGEVEPLTTGGAILGPIADSSYAIGIAELGPGDLLILYTDGVTEAAAATSGDEYGEDRLLHVARTARHHDPVAVVDRILSDVADFSGRARPARDQTILVVKRRLGAPEEAPA